MKKNRCFKLTALLLAITMMISIIPSFALGDVVNSKGSNVDGIPEIKLNSTFVTSEKILDAGKKEVKDLSAADPNGSFTLNLKVEEPVGAVSDEEKLPPDTSKVIMYYHMENMTAESGENDDISWTFDAEAKDLVFKWKKEWEEDERKSFETSIKIYPNYPAVNDISGSYVLGTATKVMMSVGNFEDGNRVRVRSSAFTEENGMIRPVTGVNPVWTLTHVTGDYYTIRSRNTGEYLYISCTAANGYKAKSLYLVTVDDEKSAQKILVKDKGNGYYSFHYNGGAITNVGDNAFYGFATYVDKNAGNADNEKFKLYSESSLVQEPTHNLSGTWYINSGNRILSNVSDQAGKMGAVAYNTPADNDNIYIPNNNIQAWTFTNVVRDWYTISAAGKYLNIKQGSVSVSESPQNLLIRSDDNFATIIISNGEFDIKGNTYCLRKKDDTLYESAQLGAVANTDSNKTVTLIPEDRFVKFSETITGSWAIVTENSGAVLLDQLSDGKLASATYSRTENGVFSLGKEIPAWTFNQVDGGWYTIQTPDGKYLSIDGKTLSLSESRAEVFVQEYNGKIRITNGLYNALKNANGNPNNGYNINDQGKAKDANEWHMLSRVDQDASMMNLLIFDLNGGTATSIPNAVMGKAGDKVILPNMEATKNGHAFMGWAEVKGFLDKNAKTGLRYHDLFRPGETYTIAADTKTLYAVYNTEENKKIQFGIRLDGVIQDEPNDYDKGAYKGHFWEDGILKESRWAIDIDSTKRVNCYYVENDVTACLNWVPSIEKITEYLKSDGNITFDPETQYIHYYVLKKTPGGDWHVDGVIRNKANIEVTYNANVPVNEKLAIANMPGSYQIAPGTEIIIGTPKNSTSVMKPVREGYVFTGWNTSPDGSGTSYPASSYIRLKSNLNLYAQWADAEGELTLTLESSLPNGQPAPEGTMVTLTAKKTGFDNLVEGVDYILQWQYSTDLKNWIDVPGAHDITYTFELNITTATYTWRVVAKDIK